MGARFSFLTITLLTSLVGCSSEGDFQILDKSGGPDEWEERRRQMNVLVYEGQPSNTSQPIEMDPGSFAGIVARDCELSVRQAGGSLGNCPPVGDLQTPQDCFEAVCQVNVMLCTAHRLMEAAQTAGSMTFTEEQEGQNGPEPHTYVMPAQSTATKAGLTETAEAIARMAVTRTGESLRAAAGRQSSFVVCDQPNDLFAAVNDEVNFGEFLANGFVESFHLVQEAAETAAEANLAAADAAFSEVRSSGKANRTAWVAPVLSRAAVAHALVGGDDGLAGFDDTGVCPGPALTSTTAAAVGLIETVAPDPAAITDLGISVDELLGDDVVVSSGPIIQRYADLYGFDDMAAMEPDEFLNVVGLTREDFTAARQYLAGQTKAFARSQSVTLPRWTKPGGATGSYDVFAVTARPPTPPPRSYYGVLARRTDVPVVDSTSGNPTVPTPEYADRGLAQTIDYAASVAFDLVGTTLPIEIRESLTLVSTDAARQRESRMQLCYARAQGMHYVMVRLYGYDGTENVRVVKGVEGLSCAVRGHVEGADCNLGDYLVSSGSFVGTASPNTGFDEYLELNLSPDWTENTDIYLVRRQPHLNDDVAGSFAEIAGATVIVYQGDTNWWEYCTDIPVAPEVEEEVASALTVSTDDCSRPAESCATPDFDKIPLEDELSSEGDGAYEQSWRHYLTLARLAADEADALGEQVIANGLQMDMRAEQAIDELEDICGASINIDALISPELDDAIDPTDCSMAACPDGYACQGGTTCVLDPLAMARERAPSSADEQRLEECLGDDVVERFVTLGSQTVCLWHADGNENDLCGGATEQPCPYLAGGGLCDKAPTGHINVTVDRNLGFFDLLGKASGGNPACSALRRLRNPWRTEEDFAKDLGMLQDSAFFDPVVVESLASRMLWEPRPGNYSAVTVDGREWKATGNIMDGATSGWPCAPDYETYPDCDPMTMGEREMGLFCESVACSSVDARRDFNYRLAGAVLAARITAGAGLEQMQYPFVFPTGLGTYGSYSEESVSSQALRTVPSLRFVYSGGDLVEGWSSNGPKSWCTASSSPLLLWTAPSGAEVRGDCDSSSTSMDGVFYVYGGGTSVLPDSAEAIAGALWSGLGPRAEYPVRDFGPLYAELLAPGNANRFREDMIVIGPSTPGIRELTSFWDLPHDNEASPNANGLTVQNLLDGMELLCEVATDRLPPCELEHAPVIREAADLEKARGFLTCIANDIERKGELTVFANVPSRVIEDVGRESGTGAYPAVGGQNGAEIAQLRAGLVDMATLPSSIATELRHMANDIERVRIALQKLELEGERANLQFMMSMTDQLAKCTQGIAGAFSVKKLGAGVVGASAGCANALAQIMFASQLNELTAEQLELSEEETIIDFRDRFESRALTLITLSGRLSEASEQVDSALVRLESLRRHGRRALSKALFLDSEPGGRHLNVNTVMRRRMNTDQKRYERAHRHAVNMAHLAKLAVEQRLGMRLADLTDDMSLVEAPSTWESTLCASSGIDYHRIRTAGLIEDDDYSDAYIGEYVRKLERVVESYRLDFPFQNASDTSVISVRDEIQNVRASCEVEVHNLLLYTEEMRVASEEAEATGWQLTGCAEPAPGEGVVDCGSVTRLTLPPGEPFAIGHPDIMASSAYRVRFGPAIACGTPCDAHVTPDTRLEQAVDVAPGRYRLSWYGRAADAYFDPGEALSVVFEDPTTGEARAANLADVQTVGDWDRYYSFFDVGVGQTVRIAISTTIPSSLPDGYIGPVVDLAGIMLEDVTGSVTGTEGAPGMAWAGEYDPLDHQPATFAGTLDTRTREVAVCEDTTGHVFRSSGWKRGCLRLCATGFGRECPGDVEATRYCYWETEFGIRQRDIERGRLIHSGGFARGNYNYRIDTLALNFVGSAARQCADERLASTCYSAAYIPYSLDHIGPYTVRNHRGEDYEAPLFQGHIEHGRGLAAERYITNPISSADRGLIEPYMHREFRGRPIDGVYRLRVWEEPGVNFEGIEDVQLVLNYRYWTRFE